MALKYARDWTLARGLEEPQGDYIEDYKKLYTEKERKDIIRILQTMRWANYTSHTVLKGNTGKWRPDLQGQKLLPPYHNAALLASDYKLNDCPCVCLKPFPSAGEADKQPSVPGNRLNSPLETDIERSYQNRLKQYTACNLWYTTPCQIWSINFKQGTMIPAGTEVSDIRITKGTCSFRTVPDGKRFSIRFCYPWHPGLITPDYQRKLFTPHSLDELTRGLSPEEIQAIKAGNIIKGMSKKAVLISFGYPPEFVNGDPDTDTWQYWKDKDTPVRIFFDRNGYAIGAKSMGDPGLAQK